MTTSSRAMAGGSLYVTRSGTAQRGGCGPFARAGRRSALILTALVVGVGLVACAHAGGQKPAGSAELQSGSAGHRSAASPPARVAYDISAVDKVKDDFPSGFTVTAGRSKTLSQDDVERSGIQVLTQARLEPPQCLPAIIPPYADLVAGTKAAGVTATGDGGGVHVTALRLPRPVPVPAGQRIAGCERITISAPSVSGVAERVPAPLIAGVSTSGVRLTERGQEDSNYIFAAALDEQTTVVVRGSVDAALGPQELMSDLLVKATTAVRGV